MMAESFTFRLETIRRLRRQERNAQRRVVAKVIADAAKAQQHVQLLNDQLQRNVSQLRFVRDTGPIDVVALRASEFHQGWLHRCILETGQALSDRRREVDRERENLARANQRLRVLDKLRERQYARFQLEQNRQEQARHDESALGMYQRSMPLITRREGV